MSEILLKADINECKVENWQSNTGEIKARELNVEMTEDLSSCAKQFVTFELANGTVYDSLVVAGKAEIPEFTESQFIKIGLYTENVNGDVCEKRYSPRPANVYVNAGSYPDGSNEPPIPTPSDYAKLLEDVKGAEKTANKLAEYTVVETDDGYYSAKAVNTMFEAVGEVFEIINEENNEKFATKTELETLKTELQGDIDEISDLVGGEGSGNEVEIETTIAEGTYTFEVDTDTGLSFYMVNDNVPYFQEKFNENDTFNVAFNGESFNNLTIKEVEGMLYIGSSSMFGLNDDVEAPFLISTLNDKGGLIVYTTLPVGSYTLSLERIIGGAE